MLVLGTKYGVDELRQEAISQLMPIFAPPGLDEWDALFTYPNTGKILPTQWEDCLLDVTNVALMHNLDRLHLMCLYHCCQLTTKEILSGKLRPDGHKETLSAEDLLSCMEGRVVLSKAYLRLLDSVSLAVVKTGCASSTACRTAIDEFTSVWRQLITGPGHPASSVFTMHNPLGWIAGKFRAELKWYKFCEVCTDAMERTFRKQRQKILKDLHLHLSQPEPRPLPEEDQN